MRSLSSSRVPSIRVAMVLALVLIVGSAGVAAAKRPPKPPPSSPTVSVEIAPSGTLEPNMEYASVDVTATCPVGWTWSLGSLYVLRGDLGGAGTFSVACTGTPQIAHARIVNGNRFQLGDWTATAYVTVVRSGQPVKASSARTIRLEPGVTARIADQGQLTSTSGDGARIAVAVACPVGATPAASFVSISQNGTALGSAPFTPVCDRFSHTFVVSMTASQGAFHTGSATVEVFATVTWNGQGFYGIDSRAITLLESSTGDTTPPTTPAGLSANVFGDGETWLSWSASSDNATPTGQLVFEIYLNGQLDQTIGGGYTQAILYAQVGVLNTIDVFAVDGAGNRSTPASTLVDLR